VRELRIPHANSQTQPYVTISVGVVSVDAYRVTTHDVAVGLADQALYEAKHQGRDRYVVMEQPQQRIDPASTTVLPLRTADNFREASGT
jgi:predicted signal transduction protein with EAL and GGDEF domain